MRQCMDADNLHRRLKKIVGQVQAIDRMVDEDVPCEDVLSQINAAKSALHKCGQVVLEGHIQHCVRDGIQHGDADKTIESFTKAVEQHGLKARGSAEKPIPFVYVTGFSPERNWSIPVRGRAPAVPALSHSPGRGRRAGRSWRRGQ